MAGGPQGILVTTSRRPTPRIRSLAKDLARTLPGGLRLTRGHLSMRDLAVEARSMGCDRVVVVGGRKGNPSIIRVYSVEGDPPGLVNIVTFIVKGVTLSREALNRLPRRPEGLVVRTDGSIIGKEFQKAFKEAFHGSDRPGGSSKGVTARIKRAGSNLVEVTFTEEGRRVGPVLRLAKPRFMVKAPWSIKPS